MWRVGLSALFVALLQDGGSTPEVIYSGPQKGERVPAFQVIDVTGGRKERTFDPTKEAGDGLAVYCMFTGPARPITRSLANVDATAREINVIAAREKRSGVKVYYVLLAPDRIEGAARLRHVWLGILPESPATIAAEGPEGPGNWGLNRRCQLTVVIAKAGKVLFNLTTTSPGDQEDDAIRAGLSETFGCACSSRPNWARASDAPGMMGSSMGMGGRGMTSSAPAGMGPSHEPTPMQPRAASRPARM